ncbi:MAG: hypothetical protein KAR06_08115 [Deltaproteobacteria bacterium]|nr:hypothetical protein [Deltaproteobacteria bacterium]
MSEKSFQFKDLSIEVKERLIEEQLEATKKFCTPEELKDITRETVAYFLNEGGASSLRYNEDGSGQNF